MTTTSHGNLLKTRADYGANAIVVQVCDWKRRRRSILASQKQRPWRCPAGRQIQADRNTWSLWLLKSAFEWLVLRSCRLRRRVQETTAREDPSKRPQL